MAKFDFICAENLYEVELCIDDLSPTNQVFKIERVTNDVVFMATTKAVNDGNLKDIITEFIETVKVEKNGKIMRKKLGIDVENDDNMFMPYLKMLVEDLEKK